MLALINDKGYMFGFEIVFVGLGILLIIWGVKKFTTFFNKLFVVKVEENIVKIRYLDKFLSSERYYKCSKCYYGFLIENPYYIFNISPYISGFGTKLRVKCSKCNNIDYV